MSAPGATRASRARAEPYSRQAPTSVLSSASVNHVEPTSSAPKLVTGADMCDTPSLTWTFRLGPSRRFYATT